MSTLMGWRMDLHHTQEPLDSAIVLGNLCECRHSVDYIFIAVSIGLSSTTLTLLAPKTTEFSLGHRFLYPSKAHMRLSISD